MFIDRPLKEGKIETHDAMMNLAFSTISTTLKETPSKQRLFLSFQTAQMIAKNDNRHMILPLGTLDRINTIHTTAYESIISNTTLRIYGITSN